MQDPGQVALALDEIALLLSLSRGNAWKVRAYERGAAIVRSLGDELCELVEQGRLDQVEGIGPSLAKDRRAYADAR